MQGRKSATLEESLPDQKVRRFFAERPFRPFTRKEVLDAVGVTESEFESSVFLLTKTGQICEEDGAKYALYMWIDDATHRGLSGEEEYRRVADRRLYASEAL